MVPLQKVNMDDVGDRKRLVAAVEKIAAHLKRIVLYIENQPVNVPAEDSDGQA